MLGDIAALGGVIVAVVGLFEAGVRLGRSPRGELTPEAAVREAMRGEDSAAVLAEFRRSGISPPERRRPANFFWTG